MRNPVCPPRLIRITRYHAVLYDESITGVIVDDEGGSLRLCLVHPEDAAKILEEELK